MLTIGRELQTRYESLEALRSQLETALFEWLDFLEGIENDPQLDGEMRRLVGILIMDTLAYNEQTKLSLPGQLTVNRLVSDITKYLWENT